MPPHTTHIQTTIYTQTHTQTFIQYAYSKTLAHPYDTAYIHTVWASTQIAHIEIHRYYKQAITYTCKYIDSDKHPNKQIYTFKHIHTYIHSYTYIHTNIHTPFPD